MKRIITIISVFTALAAALCSCDEWLEATSTTSINADDLFETRGGFTDALSGIYMLLGDSYAYGGSLSFYDVDLAAYPFNYVAQTARKAVQEHVYTNNSVKKSIKNSWTQVYNIIANINLELEQLEANRDVITTEFEYNLLKGELLGLRAYLHFDLMRLYGVADPTGQNASKVTIPYVLTLDKEPTAQLSYEKTIELLMDDIDTAVSCLESSDPLAGVISDDDFDSINQDEYWSNRQKHFNYYAALALKARIMQWQYKFDEAAQYAQKVIDGALGSGFLKWVDTDIAISEATSYAKDRTFSTEQIFSLEITNLYVLCSSIFAGEMTNEGFVLNDTFVDNVLYVRLDPETGSLAGSEDLRGPAFNLSLTTTGYYGTKFMVVMGDYRNRFPMMRISEMYYILAESLIEKGDNEGALAVLDEVRRNRAISDTYPSSASAEDELMKEYYREFQNEGKLIYWLKHKKVESSLNSAFTLTYRDLTFPYPDDEINYGRVQEL